MNELSKRDVYSSDRAPRLTAHLETVREAHLYRVGFFHFLLLWRLTNGARLFPLKISIPSCGLD